MRGRRASRVYRAYGLCLRTYWPLPFPEVKGRGSGLAAVELFDGAGGPFRQVSREAMGRSGSGDWFQHVQLRDGSDYLRWSGLFEFLVSPDGRRIACHSLTRASAEAFHAYLLGQVLSFALIKQGIEPLHSTAMVIDGEAVGFVGDTGYGKSSLGAAFLQAGHSLLTDDLLVLKDEGNRFVAYPGPPRIKLFPGIARSLLGERVTGTPMNNQTPKLVIPLDQNGTLLPQGAFPLKAMYVLTPPPASSRGHRITIRLLSPRRAFVELLKNTFNTMVVDRERLRGQFNLAARLASKLPVKSLSYPRRLDRLPEVHEAIQSDLVR
ncbi:MAG: hypothetical protein ACE5NC_08900 [Anaerolineae bacterium]